MRIRPHAFEASPPDRIPQPSAHSPTMHVRLPLALTLFSLLAPLASAIPAAIEQRNNGGHPTSIIKTTTAVTKTASGPPGPTGTAAVFDLGLFHLLREIVQALPQDVPFIVDPSTGTPGSHLSPASGIADSHP
jgi:hypothetical protein